MKWLIFVLVIAVAILLVICYSLMVMAHDADERAEQMYKKWNTESPPDNIRKSWKERDDNLPCGVSVLFREGDEDEQMDRR